MKRVVSMLLAVAMLLGTVPMVAFAEAVSQNATVVASGTCEYSLTWTLDDTGTLTISGTGAMDSFSSYINAPWYSQRGDIVNVVIEEGVTTIGAYAFDSSNLTSVTIPSSVTRINAFAFNCCDDLTGVYISDIKAWCNIRFDNRESNPLHYANNLYLNGELVTDVVIPSDVKNLMSYVFTDCSSLISVIIPEGVTGIGEETFKGCSNLKSIIIPNSVTQIDQYAFCGCSSLTSITIPDGVTEISHATFHGCTALASITIPDSVTKINSTAFTKCSSLTSITFPNSVTLIGQSAFYGCSSLTSVTIPDSVTLIDRYAFRDCTSLTSITIPDGVTKIGSDAFYGCSSLTSITIPNSVTEIGGFAFSGCKSLTSITIPDSVTIIDDSTFSRCEGLTSITIPDGVTKIGSSAFSYCKGLTSITIPDGVTVIGSSAFNACTSLSEIYFCGDEHSFNRAFPGVTATAYYPEGNETWTEAVRQNYGGKITWVPYDPENPGDGGEEEPPAEPARKPCSLAQLSSLDYLAFAQIAYMDFTSDGTVQQCLTANGYWDRYWDEDRQITYAQLCEHIAQWKVAYSQISNLSSVNGFYAVPFQNDDGEVVLAYRGSELPFKILEGDWDAYCDWIKNDLPIELKNTLGPQYTSALAIYKRVEEKWGKDNMVVTGHSLGGAWADVASAYSGCKGVTFNAVSVLDTVYSAKAEEMGRLFRGVDQWNFVDHTNKYDVLAGMFEDYWSLNRIKPYIAHDSIYASINVPANHGLQSIVEVDEYGNLRLTDTDPASNFAPSKVVSNHLSFTQEAVDLGTGSNDVVNKGLSAILNRSSFGGDGFDSIVTSIRQDTLVGGCGDDQLDGGFGDDIYAYYKGDGKDTITDVGGDDVLHLWDFAQSDTFQIVDDVAAGFIDIKCNGSVIVRIRSSNRYLVNSFRVYIQRGDEITEHDITEHFKTKKFGSHVLIACPVEIQILDAQGQVVYTLQDGAVGNYYTQYGNFYVFEEEDGTYGKMLDLVEGYYAKIVGVDTGTMDISYQSIENGEPAEPKTLSDIPVSTSFEGSLMEKEDGGTVLNIAADHDGDGVITDEDQNHLWDPGVVTTPATHTACGARTYTCTGCSASKIEILPRLTYRVIFQDWNGEILSDARYYHGDEVIAPADPTRADDDTNTYTFAGWDKEIVACTQDITYTATYRAKAKPVATAVVDGEQKQYMLLTQATLQVPEGTTVQLLRDAQEDLLIPKSLVLDLNGFDIIGQVTAASGVRVCVKDSQTDDYTVQDSCGYGKITGTVSGIQAEEGYMMVDESDGVSFHRIDLQMQSMALRSAEVGVYYSCNFSADEIVAQQVAGYGVALSLAGAPTAEAIGVCSRYDNFVPGCGGNLANGTLLQDIMKADISESENAKRAELTVYGRAYILTKDGQYILGECTTRSLRQQVELVSDYWNTLTDVQKQAVLGMYAAYQPIMSKWEIPNIMAAAG